MPQKMLVSCHQTRREASHVAHFQRKLAGTEWQPILWRWAAEIGEIGDTWRPKTLCVGTVLIPLVF